MLTKEELRTLVPHAGSMCLLDAVERWDEDTIVCLSETHRRADNPLRSEGHLAAVHAFEYGAQAMAVHGGLLARAAGNPPPPGYLAALRGARLHVEHLDTLSGPLRIEAERLMAEGDNLMYRFVVTVDDRPVAEARATVVSPARRAA